METEICYDGTLDGFFALLDRFWRRFPADWPRRVRPPLGPGVGPLFDGGESAPPALLPDPASLSGAAGVLFQVSANAYDALVRAWMSGLPLEAQALRYALKVLAAAEEAAGGPAPVPWYARAGAREGAARAAGNRGDGDCGAVLAAAYKVTHEIDRLMGFLRFKPDAGGRYAARCAPDHLVLPALAPHFTRRFGAAPWAVIDEKRGLALLRDRGAEARIIRLPGEPNAGPRDHDPRDHDPRAHDPWDHDPWEEIWRSYHRSVNIESRKNLRLQRQFVPLRYREFLTEFGAD
jgi:probable DNA metabolism protein